MEELFHVTGDDIKDLRDDDLRELIGLLCEADYRFANLRTAGIIWGGNQDAADGGFDVVIRDSIQPPINSNIPRSYTGFQVKKPAMSPKEILKEMKPNGTLRASIKEIIENNGAYIIVSSKASATNSAIATRRAAMRDAVSDITGHEQVYLDFYDRGRVATWVRSHPGLILWVKKKIGRPIQGWQPYGNWSNSPQGTDDTYLSDDELLLYLGSDGNEKGKTTTTDAIKYLREQLSSPKIFLRLVGLSGVGKTRFVEALFDKNIGEANLDQSIAVYTNLSDSPSPDPIAFANQLIAKRVRAIMIVDNCPSALHKRLVEICSAAYSKLSIVTVEYDVRDDLPEETTVVHLEPASDKLITQLIEQRYLHISHVNVSTITKISGGNFRVAIALANTFEQGETIGSLRDDDLFKRLFYQSNDRNEGLLHSAEVLSLVYSFEGTNTTFEESELKLLAGIIDQPIMELYRNISTLLTRQLIQSRNVWRAILPHAIANRLAEQALKAIPNDRIVTTLMQGPDRLLRSFARRLGYLHDNAEAKKIVYDWLQPVGWLGKEKGNLNKLGIDVLKNIAPVFPEILLLSFEQWINGPNAIELVSTKNSNCDEYVYLLRKIAYDADLFYRSAKLICRFALIQTPRNWNNLIKDSLKSLFYIYLSGTHASINDRAKIIDELWDIEDEGKQALALFLLDATYTGLNHTSYQDFSFGIRPRDNGFQPTDQKDISAWYKTFIELGVGFTFTNSPKRYELRNLLAEKFREMWIGMAVYDELENMVDQLLQYGPWSECWVTVKRMLQFDVRNANVEVIASLRRIENKLRPANLLETVRSYALSGQRIGYELVDVEQGDDASGKTDKIVYILEKLGRQVAEDIEVFKKILPNLVTIHNWQLPVFGKGLAEGFKDKMQLWQDIRSTYNNVPKEQISVQCLIGILSSSSMDLVRETIMDSLVNDEILGEYFPEIQTTMPITPKALKRLYRSLELERAPITMFKYIGWASTYETLSDEVLIPYLKKIIGKKEGINVVLDVVIKRFEIREYVATEDMLELVRYILLNLPYNKERQSSLGSDHNLAELAAKCFQSVNSNEAAKKLLRKLASNISDGQVYAFDYQRLIGKLANLHPSYFLDAFLLPEIDKKYRMQRLFNDFDHGRNPLEKIRDTHIIAWCELDPTNRYPKIAVAIRPFRHVSERNSFKWNPIVYEILERAPNILEILQVIGKDIKPNSWSGSRATIIEKRAEVLRDLFTHKDGVVVAWAKGLYDSSLRYAEQEKKHEARNEQSLNETFE